ncbi:unnamed protein product [Urochloa decumbens]|uniref:Uncharacterized protein n=1 Tax=Urochloa decumbens TaxID=240449 RepID=A0ABC9BS13_9POAL
MSYGKIPDYRRRLIDSVGTGFMIGGACGSVFDFIKGFFCVSPSGARLAAGVAQDVLRNAPRHAGLLAAYSALSCSVDMALSLARRREDPWNPIAAGAASLGLLDMRRGARAAALAAPVGAAVVAVPLGLGWYISELHGRLMSHSDAQRYRNLPRPVAIAPSSTDPWVSAGGSVEHN